MKVICSWCQSEGRPGLVREKAPLADLRETHGICSDHLQQMAVGRDPLIPGYDEGSLPRLSSSVEAIWPPWPVMNEQACAWMRPSHRHRSWIPQRERQKTSITAGMPRY